jgi:hypothetical protein
MTNTNIPAGKAKPAGKSDKKEAATKTTKSAVVIALLSRTDGATIESLVAATGWQAHSVRGFMSGTLKKKLGKAVSSEKTEAGRIYRIVEATA